MKNLLYKEFRLVISPLFFLTSLFGALLLIPEWVYFLAMMYFYTTAVPNIFAFARAQNDIGFTVMLPVRKRDIVKARVMSVVILELASVLSAAVFAVINWALFPKGNFAIDANLAFLGCVLMMYGLFNAVFFPIHYKTAYKIARAIIVSVIATILFAGVIEFFVAVVPTAAYVLDGINADALVRQLPVLACGVVAFVLLTLLAYRVSAKRFEKVDL